MFYQLYADQSLVDNIGTAVVGAYKTFSAFGRKYNNTSTIQWEDEDAFLVTCWACGVEEQSHVTVGAQAEDFLPTNLQIMESRLPQYFYLSENVRVAYYYYLDNGVRTVDTPDIEVFQDNDWRTSPAWFSDPHPVAELSAFRMYEVPKSKVSLTISGNLYSNSIGDAICLDMRYRPLETPTGEFTIVGAIGYAPYEKIIIPGDAYAKKGKNVVKKGGRGSGTIPRGTIPDMPISQINSFLTSYCQGYGYGLTYYKLTGKALSEITRHLYPSFSLSDLLTGNRKNAFVSLVGIPYDVGTEENQKQLVYLADDTITIDDGTANFVSDLMIELNFGTFFLSGTLQDTYADITHTSYTLYLPGCGTIMIDPTSCAQGWISVKGALDVRNGNILYRVLTCAGGDSYEEDLQQHPVVYGHYSGNVGLFIPISGGSGADAMGLIGAATQMGAGTLAGAVGLSTGNPALVAGGIGAFAHGTAKGLEQGIDKAEIDKSGTIDRLVGGLETPGVRLMVSQNRIILPPAYKSLVGLPSGGSEEEENAQKLSNFSGFFKVSSVDLSGLSCTDDEKKIIKNLLAEGVWI